MHSIGEFSRMTGLPVRTLRFYHEQGILEPSCVDPDTGYRYYAPARAETARVIQRLRDLDFSIQDIAAVLSQHDDEGDLLDVLERKRDEIADRLKHYSEVRQALDRIISNEREARDVMSTTGFEVEQKDVEPMLVAAVRMKGRYSDCGQGFSRIGKAFGRHICGKALMLIYDEEYKEEDADFEVCMPIRRGEPRDGIDVRELPGGRCVTLLHKGPYDELSRSYTRILEWISTQGATAQRPCREVYLKGPGMIFKGNPKRYLTELQMFLES